MTVLVWILAALSIAAALLGAVAFHRLPSPLERLHAGSFVAVAAGAPLVVAGFLSEGFTGRTLKLAVIVAILIVSGALTNHAVARALLYRGGQRR